MPQEPPYLQIYRKYADLIDSGELVPDDRLPSHKELAKEHGTTEMTVRKAISRLVEDGYVTTVHYRGTYVRAGKAARLYVQLNDILNELVDSGQDPRFRVTRGAPRIEGHNGGVMWDAQSHKYRTVTRT